MKDIFWTINAERSFNDLIDYLIKNWTNREYQKFIERTQELLTHIRNNPFSFQESDKYQNVRRAVLTNIISVYYYPNDDGIYLLFFWDNRRNPKDLKL